MKTHNTTEGIEELKDKVREWCQQNCIVGTYIGTLHEIVENWHHQELQKAQNCYCKDKAVIELIEENKKDWLREEIVKVANII